MQGAVLPQVRRDLGIGYQELGLLLSVPTYAALLIESPIGLMADAGHHRKLVLGGGVAVAIALVMFGSAGGFGSALVAMVILFPASGAFVSLTQASLVNAGGDATSAMTRWTLAGSIGQLAGPALIAAMTVAGLTWRPAYLLMAGLTVVFTLVTAVGSRGQGHVTPGAANGGLLLTAREAWRAFRTRSVLLSLAALEASDLSLDVLTGFTAVYLVDVAGASPALAAAAVGIRAAAILAGDLIAVPLFDRVDGRRVIGVTAPLTAIALAFTFGIHGLLPKLGGLAATGVLTAGWYAFLQAELYRAVPERGGSVMAISNAGSVIGGALPALLGLVASTIGLGSAMWLLVAGPLIVLVLLRLPPSDDRATARTG